MGKLVGNRYATALFESGIDLDLVEQFKKELKFIEGVLKEEEDAFKLLTHPRITRNEKKEFIDSVFENQFSEAMNNFLYILIDKKRESSFFDIVREYENMYNEYKNIEEVTAITASPINEKTLEKLKVTLENKLGKTIKISNKIDETILGGVLLEVGEKVIDGTLIGELQTIEKAIKGVSL